MMFCPRGCGIEMAQANRQSVTIDYCPRCQGVWLDKGELDKIIQMSTSKIDHLMPPPEARPAGYQPSPSREDSRRDDWERDRRKRRDDDDDDKDYHVDRHGRRRKKEHWLSDVFDIFD